MRTTCAGGRPGLPWSRVGACVAAAIVASTACGGDSSGSRPRVPVVVDLVRAFEAQGGGPPTATVDLLAPDPANAIAGWTELHTADDGSRGRMIDHFQATVTFTMPAEPGDVDVILHRAIIEPPGEHRRPRGVRLTLNGFFTGRVPPRDAVVRVRLRAGLLKPGRNLLGVRYMRPPRTRGRRPHARYVYERIDFESSAPPRPTPVADDRALVLPAGTTARFHLRAPGAARLVADLTGDGARLVVSARADGAETATQVADFAAGDLHALDLPLELPDGAIALVEIAATGAGAARLERPRIEGTRPAPPAPTPPPQEPRTAPPRNVLLYVADTLRADHLGVYGCDRGLTPHLDRFAEGAVTFTRAVAEASWTRPSVATLLTGRRAVEHGATSLRARVSPDVDTLADLAGRAGRTAGAFVTNVNVAPAFGFGRGFTPYEYLKEDFDRETVHVPATELHAAGLAWLEAHREEPFLLYLHATDPHSPYAPPAPYRDRFVPPATDLTIDPARPLHRIEQRARPPTAADLAYLRGLYDAEVATLDAAFGELLAGLDALGLAASTVVVFVGDHGEEFYDHGRFEHGRTLYDEAVHIPLIVRVPGGVDAGRRVDALVRHVDVFPTIVALAGLPMPAGLPGRPLLSPDGAVVPAAADREAYSETRFGRVALASLVIGPWKVVVSQRRGVAPQVYDLAHDPGEHHDLATDHEVLVGYARQRSAEIDFAAPPVRLPGADLDRATRDRLRQLGYVDE